SSNVGHIAVLNYANRSAARLCRQSGTASKLEHILYNVSPRLHFFIPGGISNHTLRKTQRSTTPLYITHRCHSQYYDEYYITTQNWAGGRRLFHYYQLNCHVDTPGNYSVANKK